jgi:ribosomal protein L37AE/L43A
LPPPFQLLVPALEKGKKNMKCPGCKEKLEVLRMCSRIRLQCRGCGRQYQLNEVAHLLDEETEAFLGRYTCIIYD